MRNEVGQFRPHPVPRSEMAAERTGEQSPGDRYDWYGMLFANGGTIDNPMAFPGYNHLYLGNDRTYRWMLQHPVLRLVRSIAVSAVVSSTWEYVKSSPDVPDDQVAFVKAVMDPLRTQLLNDFFVRGRDHGWAAGEPIWDYRQINGRTELVITRVKPLVQESTQVLKDPYGNFIGLRNDVPVPTPGVTGVTPQSFLSAPYKAWKYTYDSDCGYVYGRSWLENVRMTAWRDWLDCAQQLQKLGAKITGIVTIITSPAGTFPTGRTADGGKPEMVSYRENAEKIIKQLAAGAAGAWMPSLGLAVDAKGNIEANKILSQLAGKSLINVDLKDFGGNAPAITGILDRMKHDEELMFMGGLRPSRSGMEGQHGTKAEAEIHTDTGTMNSENDDKEFAVQCQPLIDAQLAIGVSEKAKGNVRIACPSLVDRKSTVVKSILLSMMNVPQIAVQMASAMDVTGLIKFLGLSIRQDFDPGALTAPDASINKPPKTPEPQGGRPPSDG